jgi:hypothetical protein
MAKVFIPQLPSRYDAASRLWIPTVNIHPAEKFGELITMLPPGAGRTHVAPLVTAMREQMRDYCDADFIVAVGDPSLIAAAACIAAKKTSGILRILKWDRIAADYIPVELTV